MSIGEKRTVIFLIGGGPRHLTIKFSELLENYFKSITNKFYDIKTFSLAEPALRLLNRGIKSHTNVLLLASTMKILNDYNKHFGASIIKKKLSLLPTIPNVVILLDWYFLSDYYSLLNLDADVYRIKIDGANDLNVDYPPEAPNKYFDFIYYGGKIINPTTMEEMIEKIKEVKNV